MSSTQAYGLIAYKLCELMENDKHGLVNFKMDEYVNHIKAGDEHWVRDQIAIAAEWCLF